MYFFVKNILQWIDICVQTNRSCSVPGLLVQTSKHRSCWTDDMSHLSM